jgi:excinuclease ABC subunit C
MNLKKKLELLPAKCGVYLMKDKKEKILYIGKAGSLRERVRSYFHSSRYLSPRMEVMVSQVSDLEYILTDSEVEALILECNLIKKHRPYYNVNLKDDKSYPYIKITNEEFPSIFPTRTLKEGEAIRYFGPYTNVKALKKTLKLIHKLFPLRSCRKKLGKPLRPCLNYHIRKCLGPCSGEVKREDYLKVINEIILFLDGRGLQLKKELSQEMNNFARGLKFEEATRVRDQLRALEKVMEEQKISSYSKRNRDVIALGQKHGRSNACLFSIREGKLLARDNFLLSGARGLEKKAVMTDFIKRYYHKASFIPEEVILENEIGDLESISCWLAKKRGGKVKIHVPRRGEKAKLVKMAAKNALSFLEEARVKEMLGAGKEAVGSMVSFKNGEPNKESYRKFKIKTVEGIDDYAMMEEVLRRRYKRVLEENKPLPDLILVDGGKGQLSSALKVLKELGIRELPVLGLAKKKEEVFLPGKTRAISLPPGSGSLRLLQRVRDEAHRFAHTYYRGLREKKVKESLLDQIPGMGEKRKRSLLLHFGSLEKIRKAGVEDLKKLGISQRLARKISEKLK